MTAPLSEPSQRITGAETDAEKATVDKIEVEATETLVVEQVEEQFEWGEVMRGRLYHI